MTNMNMMSRINRNFDPLVGRYLTGATRQAGRHTFTFLKCSKFERPVVTDLFEGCAYSAVVGHSGVEIGDISPRSLNILSSGSIDDSSAVSNVIKTPILTGGSNTTIYGLADAEVKVWKSGDRIKCALSFVATVTVYGEDGTPVTTVLGNAPVGKSHTQLAIEKRS